MIRISREQNTATEGLADQRKFYPNLSDEEFMKLISLDPTFRKESDKMGNYGKWILGLHKAGRLTNLGHVTDLLKRFEEVKKNLKDKDIMKHKTLEDLEKMLNDENSYNEQSARQKLREVQKKVHNTDLTEDAELAYEDADWQVWIPKSYEASCKLGRGTKWCTASTENSYYYNNYTRSGPLFINIFKKNPDEKYQFHFESSSYMDAEDSEIDIVDFLKSEPGLYQFYTKRLAKIFDLPEDPEAKATVVLWTDDIEDILNFCKPSRDGINGETCFTLLFDPWQEVVTWGYDDYVVNVGAKYLPDIYDENIELLRKLGFEKEDLEAILDFNVEGELEESIRESIVRALNHGKESGVEDEAHTAAIDAVITAFEESYPKITGTFDENDGSFRFVGKVKDFMSVYFNKGNYRQESLDVTNELIEAIGFVIIENYDFREPYYGFDGFDEAAFNDYLSDYLKEIIQLKESQD